MFVKGERIIHSQTGVFVIEDICEIELIKNQKRLYYVLKPNLLNLLSEITHGTMKYIEIE